MSTFDPLLAKALRIHERLCAEYGCPVAFFHTLDPLSELVSSLLSHRTRNTDSGRAFRQLRAAFPTWEEVRDAPTEEIQAAIAPCTWPEQKTPRIQGVLRRITESRGGELALDLLAEIPVRAGADGGRIGVKQSAARRSGRRCSSGPGCGARPMRCRAPAARARHTPPWGSGTRSG